MYEAASNTVCRIRYESAYQKAPGDKSYPVLHFFGPNNHEILNNLISCMGVLCAHDSKTSADRRYYTDLYVYVDSQTHYDNCVIFLNTVASRYPTYRDSVAEAKALLHENCSQYETKAPRVGIFREAPAEAPLEAVQDATDKPVEDQTPTDSNKGLCIIL